MGAFSGICWEGNQVTRGEEVSERQPIESGVCISFLQTFILNEKKKKRGCNLKSNCIWMNLFFFRIGKS